MILSIDVYYSDTLTRTCGVIFNDWNQKTPDDILILEENFTNNEYEPGNFYKRELPHILNFLNHFKLKPDFLVIDGFINLKENDGNVKDGLGGHLSKYLKDIKIIGVAKSRFCKTNEISYKAYRGNSKNPLYVQPIEFGEIIENMHGEYRIPELLKITDKGSKIHYEK